MRYKLFFVVFFLHVLLSCAPDRDGPYGYPRGISEILSEQENDCSLPACSKDRIVRMRAKNVKGILFWDSLNNRYGVRYAYTFDSYLNLYFCDLPDDIKQEDLSVKFSGDLIDACGVLDVDWPVEKYFLVRIDRIKKI